MVKSKKTLLLFCDVDVPCRETDVHKLNDQKEFLRVCESRYKKMELRVASHEAAQARMEEESRYCHDSLLAYKASQLTQPFRLQQQQIQTLQAQLSLLQKQLTLARKSSPRMDMSTYQAELTRLKDANMKLRDENTVLREELEEYSSMVEYLKGQVSGKQSLVSDPKASPFLGPALQI